MPIARKYLVDPEIPFYYHVTSRCVRRAWLLGDDPITKRNVDHRKDWLVGWMKQIAPAFPVAIQTYAIMSNHFHLVLYYDPLASKSWSAEEVARRWLIAHPTQLADPQDEIERDYAIAAIVEDSRRVERYRSNLGSLSSFMKCLKQPIAQRANREDNQDGHFWSKRFYSGAIVSEAALLDVMNYVDLNPVRAKIAAHINECKHTGLHARMQAIAVDEDAVHRYLEPCASGLLPDQGSIKVTLNAYKRKVEETVRFELEEDRLTSNSSISNEQLNREQKWLLRKQVLAHKPRVIGTAADILTWLSRRGFKRRELAMPTH